MRVRRSTKAAALRAGVASNFTVSLPRSYSICSVEPAAAEAPVDTKDARAIARATTEIAFRSIASDRVPCLARRRKKAPSDETAKRHGDDRVEIFWAGTPIVMDAISKEVVRTQTRFLISFFGITVILYFAFGSLQGMILPLTTAVFAVAWGVGLMAGLGIVIDGWTVMTPILVLSVAAGHSAQILKRYYEEYELSGDNRRR